MIKVKKDLKDLNPTDLDFPEGTRLFINDTLCGYYRVLWNKQKNYESMRKNMLVSKIWAKKLYMTIFQKYRLSATPYQLPFFFSNIRIDFTIQHPAPIT